MSVLEIDYETRSDVDLSTRGVYVYMDSPHTAPLMASYQIDGGEVKRWLPHEPCPADIVRVIESGGTCVGHNVSFERLLWQKIMTPRYGWPVLRTEQCRCTAATAAALALPRSLGNLGEALGLDIVKDKEGSRLIKKFSMPRKPLAHEDPAGLYWNEPADHPADFELFRDYNDQDVRAEAAADSRMVPMSADEQAMWVIDQRINDRGIRIDIDSARAAIRLADKAKAGFDAEMREATDGFVRKCTEPAKIVQWVADQGVELSSAAKADITDLLDLDDVPPHVRRVLEIRQEAGKTSVQKLQAMINRASADGRVRGSFLFNGASTGRWASTGVNFANMPRNRKEYEDAHLDPATLFEVIRTEDPTLVQFMYGPKLGRPLHLISDAIRSFIWAAPGHELVQADYTGIEGAVIAWSSGEDWKVEALREIMANPELPDMYRRAAAGIMSMTTDEITKKHPLRQSVGKVSELALGFGGGVVAFYAMSKTYGVKLDPLYEPVWAAADEERRERAVKRYNANLARGEGRTDVLSRKAWLACEIIKVGWRATNPAIAAGWKAREEGARNAIRNPGTKFDVLKVSYIVAHGFLWCRLPSGRCLAYAAPELKAQVWAKVLLPDGSWSDSEVMDKRQAEKAAVLGTVKIEGDTSPSISALGVGKNKKLHRFNLYGGLFAENDTQAIAADLLRNGMRKAEANGYPLIAHVYDEVIAEVPRGTADLAFFEKLICELPGWCLDLPLTAGGFIAKRYRKG